MRRKASSFSLMKRSFTSSKLNRKTEKTEIVRKTRAVSIVSENLNEGEDAQFPLPIRRPSIQGGSVKISTDKGKGLFSSLVFSPKQKLQKKQKKVSETSKDSGPAPMSANGSSRNLMALFKSSKKVKVVDSFYDIDIKDIVVTSRKDENETTLQPPTVVDDFEDQKTNCLRSFRNYSEVSDLVPKVKVGLFDKEEEKIEKSMRRNSEMAIFGNLSQVKLEEEI